MLRTRWTPSPCARLSRARTTTGPPSHPGGINRRRAFPPTSWLLAGEGTVGMVPTFTLEPFDGIGAQLCPCNIATATPQAFTVASRPATSPSPKSSPPQHAGARCNPALIRQVRAGGLLLRSVQPLVPHVRLSVSLAGPGPSGSAGPSRRCQGCFHPPPRPRRSGCPQLQRACCDRPMAVSFHHRTVRERLVALDVGDPQLVGSVGAEVALDQIGRAAWAVGGDRGPSLGATGAPGRPIWRISRSTVQRATPTPSRCSCRHTLRAP